MKRELSTVIALLLIICLQLSGCRSKDTTTPEASRYVKVMKTGLTEANQKYVFNGQVKEKREVNIAFKVGGQVLDILVDEGDFVQKGEVIALIDTRDYQIQLQNAQAQFNQISSEYKRYQQLYDKNKLPANTLEKLKAGYMAAQSAYEAAKNALNDTKLTAPFNGYIYNRRIDKFENIAPGQAVVTLIDVSELEVHFSLSERQVKLSQKFNHISCDIRNANLVDIPAELLSVNHKANGNDMFDVRLLIPNQQTGSLKPGMSAIIKVHIPEDNTTLIQVPVKSIFYKNKQAHVWIYQPNTQCVQLRPINIKGFNNNGFISVSEGLQKNEIIVVAGVNSLYDKQKVKVLGSTQL